VSLSINSSSFKVFNEELHIGLATLLLLLLRHHFILERFLNYNGTCRVGRGRECLDWSVALIDQWGAMRTRSLNALRIQIIFLPCVGVEDTALIQRVLILIGRLPDHVRRLVINPLMHLRKLICIQMGVTTCSTACDEQAFIRQLRTVDDLVPDRVNHINHIDFGVANNLLRGTLHAGPTIAWVVRMVDAVQGSRMVDYVALARYIVALIL
jgi:hypothetical protein